MYKKNLYFKDPYLFEYKSIIKEIIKKDDKYHLLLEETIFYPLSGGQPNDLGFIDDIAVLDVYEKNNLTYHVLNKKPSSNLVSLKIDINRRIYNMKHHSAQHLLSACIYNLFKLETTSLNISNNYVSLDILDSKLNDEDIKRIELYTNKKIMQNLNIKTYFKNKEELKKLPLRKEVDLDGILRVVEIENFDYSTCCGTHVAKTGEIGILKIIKYEYYKKNTRIYFKCAINALNDYILKNNIINKLKALYSSTDDNLLNNINIERENMLNLKKENKDLKIKLLKFQAQKYIDLNKKFIILDEECEFKELIELGNIISNEKITVLGINKNNKKIFLSSFLENINPGLIFKNTLKEYNAKGGGSSNFAQGAFLEVSDLDRYIDYIKNTLGDCYE
ncbi:MAG: DHHA1 domain-containing protein [Peptostreptococcaceae bacterium]|jgi:alanyl-tRNA synthetase|nr:DHHA1 domain-containing protein [Peptostreptococcaceae bacterium]